jgi:hypothetical protein
MDPRELMPLKLLKNAQAVALAFTVLTVPALACDKAASNDRIAKVVAKGDVARPTRVSEGYAVEVSEKFWSSADAKVKEEIATDVSCSIGTDLVTFTRDRSSLQSYRNGKPQ